MNTTTQNSLLWFPIIATIVVTATGHAATQPKMLQSDLTSLPQREQLQGPALLSKESNGFPFEIKDSTFVRKSDGKLVFLNIICYQPLEPGQWLDDEIRAERVRDDLRRWRAYQGGLDPVVLRVYPQPTPVYPRRISKAFYDEVRELGFWIIRDVYFDQNFCNPNFIENGHRAIDAVIAEVNDANALDLIFAWEIGNEFIQDRTPCWNAGVIKQFIENMCSYLKAEVGKLEANNVSNLVTWASYPPYDPLFTDLYGTPILPKYLDYISYNTYSYHPEHIYDHQAGPITGTPYQGYLVALKERYPDKPLVISETGLSDSVGSYGSRLCPGYPSYRYGGMSSEQVAEGLADRYWDAYLLSDENDANIVIAGITIFEWSDEWWKGGTAEIDDQLPEEHFGLGRFVKRTGGGGYQLRYKLQQETIHDLYSLAFDNNTPIIKDVIADNNSLWIGGSTLVHAILSDSVEEPVRYRWETNRGCIIGDSNSVKFYAGNDYFGLAKVTVVAIDANSNADIASTIINIAASEPIRIEILTVGTGVNLDDQSVRASGRISNVNLDEYKLVCYIYNWHFYVQPYTTMKSIWVGPDGYWWTKIFNAKDNPGELYCWLVPKSWDPPNEVADPHWSPPEYIAEANTVNMVPSDYNDVDNDLLQDKWEEDYFGNIDVNDRYDDPDNDGANNLEEFLAGTSPVDGNDNDSDGDNLPDNWEYHYFGDVNLYDANDDPDGDGLKNWQEQDPNLGTHPGRASQDIDQDGLPDLWEIRWFGNVNKQDDNDNFDDDCFNNLDEYELGLDPTICMGNLDCDWDVDLYDYSRFALHWREVNCNKPDWCGKADLNRDGEVNWADLRILAENWLLEL